MVRIREAEQRRGPGHWGPLFPLDVTHRRAEQRAKNGNMAGNNGDAHVHYHNHSPIQALDSDGVDKVLQQHGEKFVNHAANELRRRNF
jgi:hypothetical protein